MSNRGRRQYKRSRSVGGKSFHYNSGIEGGAKRLDASHGNPPRVMQALAAFGAAAPQYFARRGYVALSVKRHGDGGLLRRDVPDVGPWDGDKRSRTCRPHPFASQSCENTAR